VSGIALHCASKAALEEFTKVAAREFGPRGITVNTVSPGPTDTEMLPPDNPPEALGRTVTPLTRLRGAGSASVQKRRADSQACTSGT
jgi:3-oxoacyl-[acyl-carrier protein] reductase